MCGQTLKERRRMNIKQRMSQLKTLFPESKESTGATCESGVSGTPQESIGERDRKRESPSGENPDSPQWQRFAWKLLQKNQPERETTPAEVLLEMGAQLRQLRQAQSLTLEDVAMVTLIAPRVLNAIEEGDLEKLPEPVYVQGFIRRFADALGLDGTAFAKTFPAKVEIQQQQSTWRGSPEAQLRPIHLYLLYVGLVFFSVRSLSNSMERVAIAPNLPDLPTTSAEQPTAKPKASLMSAKASSNTSKPTGKKVRVGITVTEASWILVEADGKVAFEGMLSEGTHTWEANEQLTISAGNAGGVLITHNGSQAEKMGAPGEVEEVTFKVDSQS
jgi:cytoskeletal protein RodZ